MKQNPKGCGTQERLNALRVLHSPKLRTNAFASKHVSEPDADWDHNDKQLHKECEIDSPSKRKHCSLPGVGQEQCFRTQNQEQDAN